MKSTINNLSATRLTPMRCRCLHGAHRHAMCNTSNCQCRQKSVRIIISCLFKHDAHLDIPRTRILPLDASFPPRKSRARATRILLLNLVADTESLGSLGLFAICAYQINGQYVMQFNFDSKLDYLIGYIRLRARVSVSMSAFCERENSAFRRKETAASGWTDNCDL
jgi:hypothetical protein